MLANIVSPNHSLANIKKLIDGGINNKLTDLNRRDSRMKLESEKSCLHRLFAKIK